MEMDLFKEMVIVDLGLHWSEGAQSNQLTSYHHRQNQALLSLTQVLHFWISIEFLLVITGVLPFQVVGL